MIPLPRCGHPTRTWFLTSCSMPFPMPRRRGRASSNRGTRVDVAIFWRDLVPWPTMTPKWRGAEVPVSWPHPAVRPAPRARKVCFFRLYYIKRGIETCDCRKNSHLFNAHQCTFLYCSKTHIFFRPTFLFCLLLISYSKIQIFFSPTFLFCLIFDSFLKFKLYSVPLFYFVWFWFPF